jgi:RNA polymerase sigma-70 factor (ECF subfamily)
LLKGDVEKAEDLASDVFLKVMKNIDKYKHEKLSSWIHTMARNVFLDSLRLVKEKENKKTISIDVQLEFHNGSKSLFQLSDSTSEIEENEKERNSKLLKALKSLKESDLKLIDLRFYQGLNYKEIAIEVGKTENYCRVAIDRIKSKLKKII